MTRSPRRLILLGCLAATPLALGACGSEGVQLAKSDPNYRGAEIFAQRCGGCHTLNVAGTQGSATNVRTRELKDGPNFNQRKEDVNSVLYAIRNGGFSSGPMPQNIVVGQDAQEVARFIAANSGKLAPPQVTVPQSSGSGG